MRATLSLALAIGLTGSAAAQYEKGTWLFEVVGGPVSPSNSQVTVRLYAAFPMYTTLSAFGRGNLGISSSDASGWFSDLTKGTGIHPDPFCGFAVLGTPNSSGGVDGLIFNQWGVLGCQPIPGSPSHVWEATWTTTDFSPRNVSIQSINTSYFDIYSSNGKEFFDVFLYPDKFEHGSGVIQVVPAPGGAILLAATIGLAAGRKR